MSYSASLNSICLLLHLSFSCTNISHILFRCFCIPGSAPPGSKVCSDTENFYGDDPNANAPPCYTEYEAAREAIDLASKMGKPLVEVRLPYCTEDGYYQSKQCLGSM